MALIGGSVQAGETIRFVRSGGMRAERDAKVNLVDKLCLPLSLLRGAFS
jgi:hypothetical protein